MYIPKPEFILQSSRSFLKQYRKELSLLALLCVGFPLIVLSFGAVDVADFQSMSWMEQLERLQEGGYAESSTHGWYAIFDIWLTIGTLILPGVLYVFLFQQYASSYQNIQGVLREYASRIFKLIGTSIFYVCLLVLLIILLVIPAIIFGIFRIFTTQVVLFYNVWGMDALRKSKELVQGRRRETFGYALGYGLVVGLLQVMPLLIIRVGYTSFGRNPVTDLLSNVLGVAIQLLGYLVFGFLFLSWKQTYDQKQSHQIVETAQQMQ